MKASAAIVDVAELNSEIQERIRWRPEDNLKSYVEGIRLLLRRAQSTGSKRIIDGATIRFQMFRGLPMEFNSFTHQEVLADPDGTKTSALVLLDRLETFAKITGIREAEVFTLKSAKKDPGQIYWSGEKPGYDSSESAGGRKKLAPTTKGSRGLPKDSQRRKKLLSQLCLWRSIPPRFRLPCSQGGEGAAKVW